MSKKFWCCWCTSTCAWYFFFLGTIASTLLADGVAAVHADALHFFRNATSEKLPIIAYSVVGYHGDMFGIPMALAAIFHPRNVYGVMLDASVPMMQVSALHKQIVDMVRTSSCDAACVEAQIFVKRLDFSITHGGISEPLAYLDTLNQLLKFAHWDFAINLTPVDYPLTDQDNIARFLSSFPNQNFLGTHATGVGRAAGKFFARWHQIHHDPSLLHIRRIDTNGPKNDRQTLLNLHTNLPSSIVDSSNVKVYQGEAYTIICRPFAHYAINSPLSRRLIALLSNGFGVSEQLLPSILGNSPQFESCPTTLRMNNAAAGPMIAMTSDNKTDDVVMALAKTGLLFARKFPTMQWSKCSNDNPCTNESFRTAVHDGLLQRRGTHVNILQQIWMHAAFERLTRLNKTCLYPKKQ